MKPSRLTLFFAGALCALILSACSTPDSRIQANPETFARLSPAEQALVRVGQVGIGMSTDAVKLALGDPDRVARRTDAAGQTQIWHYVTYEDNGVVLYTGYYHRYWHRGWGDGWGGGWGWGGAYPYYLNYPNRSVHDRFRVEFGPDNRVTSVTQDNS